MVEVDVTLLDVKSSALRIVLALLIVVAWLGVSGVGGPTFGRLSEVSSNDQATFLPASAESTKAKEFVAEFLDSNQIPALVVTELPETLQPQQMAELAPLVEDLKGVEGVADVIGPIPAESMEAVQYIALVDTEEVLAADAVDDLRAVVGDGGSANATAGPLADAEWLVTGPAGISADTANAFDGIDGVLLLVALGAVLVILVIVYRSILLPLIVILTAVAALCGAILTTFWMAKADWISLNAMSQGILSILVIGAATDYGLLLVARQREELTRNESVVAAVIAAVRGSFGAITASASTVAIALLCLLFSDLNSNRSLGPIAATGIVFAWFAALTFLPAMLLLLGRAAFWPVRPHYRGSRMEEDTDHGIWSRIARFVAKQPRKVWAVTLAFLLLGAVFVPTLKAEGVPATEIILGDSEAKQGLRLLDEHFSAGSGSPTQVIVPEEVAQDAIDILNNHDGVDAATLTAADGAPAGVPPMNAEPKTMDGKVYIQATLSDAADSDAAQQTVRELRTEIHKLGDDILIGGTTATAIDTNDTGQRDLKVIIPLVLLVVWVILVILLRAILLPTLLITATVISFGTAMGVAALMFNHVFKFPGADASVPLYGFVFLVALGIDYTIFLMTRAREEARHIGTRDGVLKSLAVTGGVITSAGIVLAATFSALAVIPLMIMIQLAFIVAFGVLIDTLIVRTLLVPGLVLDIGPKVWWPWRRQADPQSLEEAARS